MGDAGPTSQDRLRSSALRAPSVPGGGSLAASAPSRLPCGDAADRHSFLQGLDKRHKLGSLSSLFLTPTPSSAGAPPEPPLGDPRQRLCPAASGQPG